MPLHAARDPVEGEKRSTHSPRGKRGAEKKRPAEKKRMKDPFNKILKRARKAAAGPLGAGTGLESKENQKLHT